MKFGVNSIGSHVPLGTVNVRSTQNHECEGNFVPMNPYGKVKVTGLLGRI